MKTFFTLKWVSYEWVSYGNLLLLHLPLSPNLFYSIFFFVFYFFLFLVFFCPPSGAMQSSMRPLVEKLVLPFFILLKKRKLVKIYFNITFLIHELGSVLTWKEKVCAKSRKYTMSKITVLLFPSLYLFSFFVLLWIFQTFF